MSNAYISEVLSQVKQRNAHEPEFLQAVEEVLESLEPVVNQRPDLQKNAKLTLVSQASIAEGSSHDVLVKNTSIRAE